MARGSNACKPTINYKTMMTLFQIPLHQLVSLAVAGLTALLLTQPASAQAGDNGRLAAYTQPAPAVAPAFEAAVFPSLDPLILKVVFRNPARASLHLLLRNEQQEVVFRKPLGRPASYNSRVHLEVADGNYTLEITGGPVRYAKALRVGTKVARLAEVRY